MSAEYTEVKAAYPLDPESPNEPNRALHAHAEWQVEEPLISGQDSPGRRRSADTEASHRKDHVHAWRWLLLGVGLTLVSLAGANLWLGAGMIGATGAGQARGAGSSLSVQGFVDPYGYDPSEKTVVIFVHHDSGDANTNLRFFLAHALHDRADFIFVFNGESEVSGEIPTDLPNVRVVQRGNDCYDLGAHGEVLTANDREVVKKYDKFILMNASVRGPLMPRWSRDCWTNVFTNMVTDEVKLVGLTLNCLGGSDGTWGVNFHSEGFDEVHKMRHIQAMMLASDKVGIDLLLTPLGLDACHSDYQAAVDTELRLASQIWHGGYHVTALMNEFNNLDNFEEECLTDDPMQNYVGGYMPVTETIFAKTKKLPAGIADQYAWWARNYSSYDNCPVY